MPAVILHNIKLALAIGIVFWGSTVYSSEYNENENLHFDSSFLRANGGKQLVDIKRFEKKIVAYPGVYKVDLYVNGSLITKGINVEVKEDEQPFVCVTKSILKYIPFDFEKLPEELTNHINDECVDFEYYLKGSELTFDSHELRIDFTIPQNFIVSTPRGFVSPELWDSGITALLLGYNINGFTSKASGQQFNSFFAGVNSGFNLGQWYFRHNGSYSYSNDGVGEYNNINSFLQRDIPSMESRFILGQSNTDGNLFDTIPFNGIQLATDERMLPESLRGYAPDIRGIARTNARVTIRQSGQILYETTVPPGEFLINDLYPTGFGGNLDVTVREADGTEQYFTVPFTSTAQLLRPSAYRYSITAGKLRDDYLFDTPSIYQLTYQRGVSNSFTVYGGGQVSEAYNALQLGTAIGTAIGAFAFDVTRAETTLQTKINKNDVVSKGGKLSDYNYRLSYNYLFQESGSNLSVSASRSSGEEYFDFMTAVNTRSAVEYGESPNSILRVKERITASLGHNLGSNLGQLYLVGSMQNYWGNDGNNIQYQLGYNNRYKDISYGLSVNRSSSNLGVEQTNYLFSLSFPLGNIEKRNIPQLRFDLSRDSNGRYGQQATISGISGSENQISYGATAMFANKGEGISGSSNVNYRSPITTVSGSISAGEGYYGVSGGIRGMAVGHAGGITLAPYASETIALVEAKGAEGARVSSYPGVMIDSSGYALVPYLTPYQINQISIDPSGISKNVEFENTSQQVAPYYGALVKLTYRTNKGIPILIYSTYKNESLPFGANVFDSEGNEVGIVGQGGVLYARVSNSTDYILVKWGSNDAEQCRINYSVTYEDGLDEVKVLKKNNMLCVGL